MKTYLLKNPATVERKPARKTSAAWFGNPEVRRGIPRNVPAIRLG